MTVVSREALQGLRAKYAQMLEMRVAHEGGLEKMSEVRIRMTDLACRFPGALREIDDLELVEIRQRIADLDAVLAGTLEAAPWMHAIALFHALARGVLCAKRWLAGRKRVDAALRREFLEAVPSLLFPEEARLWAGDLEIVAAPPRGRVTDLVISRIAQELGVPERDARHLVFGRSRRGEGRLRRD